jgi:hypothetical protein
VRVTAPDEPPQGVTDVLKRARGNGFNTRVVPGNATVERKRKVLRWNEDGSPELTVKGTQRYNMAPGEAEIASWGVYIDGHGQSQAGYWVDGFQWAIAWPADRSDIPRAVGATRLGTVIDLDALRDAAISRARASKALRELGVS